MDERVLQELFAKQGQAIATLALRITTIEQILLEKGIITETEVTQKAIRLSKEFTLQTQEALRRVAEESKRESKGE
jgi:hypothetical protein